MTDEEKIEILISRLNNIEMIIKSYIDNAELLKDKYSLEDELTMCENKKVVLIKTLKDLGGEWPQDLD